MAKMPQNEGYLTSVRILELQLNPVQGHFDTTHLKEVHRRIFQDLVHHAPGEFRPDAPGQQADLGTIIREQVTPHSAFRKKP